MRSCAREGCEESFVIGPKNEHQKYHCRACGDAARKRWLQPERQRYMREYMPGYIRVRRSSDDVAAAHADNEDVVKTA
jgi:hypothetical protein